MRKRYYLSFMGMKKEVTKEEYIKAERQAGFYSKFGPDHEAIGGVGYDKKLYKMAKKGY